MKVLPFKIPKPEKSSLIFQEDKGPQFYPHLHQHQEAQLTVILQGEGDFFVGDTIGRYSPGDVLIVGSNLPHLFKSDEAVGAYSHMVSLFFTNELFDHTLFEGTDFKNLRDFLSHISSGVRLKNSQKKIQELLVEIGKSSGLQRNILFFELLDSAMNAETDSLSSFINQKDYSEAEGSRMSDVMDLAFNEFHRTITLDEVANVAHMTKHSFCRYFKQRTRKTFFEFLMEIRTEHAARLLIKSPSLSISEIADMSGFRSMSNFNRQFKSLKFKTPSQFRKDRQ